ncbi:hypothetical protein KY343_03245 [Candidatus Woesearchaeota archaeon]|nr:hypothetical protein [Candidatus Woesearchaeota archaeon]
MDEEQNFVLRGKEQVNRFYSVLEESLNTRGTSHDYRGVSPDEIPLIKDHFEPSKSSLGWTEVHNVYEVKGKKQGVVLGTIDFKAYYEAIRYIEDGIRSSGPKTKHVNYIASVKIQRKIREKEKDALDFIVAEISPDTKD